MMLARAHNRDTVPLRSLTETYDIHELKLQPFLNTLIKPGMKRFKARLNLLTETLIGTLVG